VGGRVGKPFEVGLGLGRLLAVPGFLQSILYGLAKGFGRELAFHQVLGSSRLEGPHGHGFAARAGKHHDAEPRRGHQAGQLPEHRQAIGVGQ
jgi:hypothetical protein